MTVLGDNGLTRVSTMMTFAGIIVDYPKYDIPDGTDSYNYLHYAGHAKLFDNFFFFGGSADGTQISFLTGCVIQKTSFRLPYIFQSTYSSAIFHFKTSNLPLEIINCNYFQSLFVLFKWKKRPLLRLRRCKSNISVYNILLSPVLELGSFRE